jgi:PAS domain S-box-containing protein
MQPDGIVLAANATVAQRLGVTLERTVGADIYHLTSAEVAMRRRRYADQVIATGQPARFEDSRGDRILDNAIYPVRDAQGRVTQLAVLGMDITERKQAELALHESEERLRLANRATRDVIWDWDIVNDSQQWNAAGTVALGWRDIVEAPQTAAWWIERVHPEDRQRVDAGFFAVVTDPAQNYWYDEYRFRRLDGSYAQIIDRGYVLRNAQGAAVRMIGAMLDITERKQMEEALRATETNYQELINGMKDTVWVIDFDGNLIDVNSAAVEVTGYTREELLNIGIYGIDSALRREQIHALAQAMSADKVQVFQTCHRTKAGRSFPVEICSSLVTYHGQRAILSIARDITERKHAEETLRQNQQHLARAQQIGRLGSWDWDTQRQTLTWSDELYRIFGVESDFALTYDNIEALLHPEDRRRNAAETQQLLSGAADQTRYEFRIIRPDGEVRHISQNIEVTRDQTDAVARMFGIMQDITERKLAEERLRLSEARYRNLVETQADAISRSDLDGNLSFANDAFCRTFGVKREEVLGTNFQPTIVPEDWPVILAVREAISRPPYRRYAEIRNITSSGIRWIGWDNSAVLDEHGQIIEFQGVGRDITERKLAEEALHRANADLARSNTELERFAYVASHDLQEPLRMVASFVQLLGERYRGQLDADADEFIGFAVDGAKRMQTLINDLLEYSRVGTRGEPLQPTDANVALDDALWNLDLAISEAGATVTHDPLPTVLADPVQLAQLFQNLISNAIKFHGAQPPVVHVSARQTFEVSETSKVSGAQVWQFAVRDNGIGIAPQDHERIFGIFQRLHTREAYAGTGIGLAVCQRIVERHGGRIWVESQLGQGTTFYFTLPAGGDR